MKGASPQLREDFLVSFCFAAEHDFEAEIAQLSRFAHSVESAFRFWEIVYVAPERYRAHMAGVAHVLSKFTNLRVILVRDGVNFYRRRAIGVSEAIGDVVVLTSMQEMNYIDAQAIAGRAYETEEIVLGCRASRFPSFSVPHLLLSLLTSHRINERDMKTIAIPRQRLSWLISRPTLVLDLRFEPKHSGQTYNREFISVGGAKARRSAFADRFELLEELISTSAPRMLRAYAAVSAVVAAIALIYALYAVVIVLVKPDVQPGWFSTAIVQSGSVGFIAIGMLVLGLGVATMAERLSGQAGSVIVDEITNTSVFGGENELNVETTANSSTRTALAKQ